jgi:hypothetical protein
LTFSNFKTPILWDSLIFLFGKRQSQVSFPLLAFPPDRGEVEIEGAGVEFEAEGFVGEVARFDVVDRE